MKRIYTRKPDPIEAWQYDGSEAMARAIGKELDLFDEQGELKHNITGTGESPFVFNFDMKGGLRVRTPRGETTYLQIGDWFFFGNSKSDGDRWICSTLNYYILSEWRLAQESNHVFGEPEIFPSFF